MKSWAYWILVLSSAGGCTVNSVPQVDAYESPAGAHTKSIEEAPVRVSRTVPKDAVVVSDVEADYCHKTLSDRADAESAVLTSLQADAHSLGADGIAHVEMNTQIANAFIDPCWKQVTATGVAYKLAP